LYLLPATNVRQFFGTNFFDKKRSAAGDRNFKAISLENKGKGTGMCLAAVKIKMKGIAAFLGFETRTTQRHLPPPPKASPPAIDTKSVCPGLLFTIQKHGHL
jgi:hypothetical protein